MIPLPTIFNFVEDDGKFGIKRVHPLPDNEFIQVGAAGMGFVLMHRSVVDRILDANPEATFFAEVGVNKAFMGEDIFFFSMCHQAGIPLWCDTSARVPHMKRFSFDEHYYKAFFGGVKQESNLILPKRMQTKKG